MSSRNLIGQRSWRAACLLVIPAAAAVSAAQVPAPAVHVLIDTEKGAIEIVVEPARAPATVANFLRYVDAGAYDGGQFHRTVRPDTETNQTTPIQVIQASQRRAAERYDPIPLERTRDTGLRHLDGVVSMARAQPDSARSDVFICIGDQPSLDFGGPRNPDGQGFAAFGRVVAGMEVVRAIQGSPVDPGTQTLAPPVRIVRVVRKPR